MAYIYSNSNPKPTSTPWPDSVDGEWEPLMDEKCPGCGRGLWRAPWWDDPPEHGGACIGDIVRCGYCDYEDWR